MDIKVKQWYNLRKQWLNQSPDHVIKIKVMSDSMSPVLNRGDIVNVKSILYEPIGIGSVVVYFHWSNNATIHRVIDIVLQGGLRYFQTKGDANPVLDAYLLREEEIIGVAKFDKLDNGRDTYD